MEEHESNDVNVNTNVKKKRTRRRRKPKSAKAKSGTPEKPSAKPHDAPMTKRDLYFTLFCEMVTIGHGGSAVARVFMLNWDTQVVLDTFVQVPVPVKDFRDTGIQPDFVSTSNKNAMTFAKVRLRVYQILKGKILVGYNVKEHLKSLGLSHPASDIRDSSDFRPFTYEEIDGVTDEVVVVERPLEDLAAEFLQRHVDIPLSPLESSTIALDLYKAFRKEWEKYLVKETQQKENMDQHNGSSQLVSSESQQRARLPSFDYSVASFGDTAARDRTYSWPSPESSRPALTSQALEILTLSEGVRPSAAPFSDYASLRESSSNYGSSAYYEDSSVVSDSYASVSVASSHPEDMSSHYFHSQAPAHAVSVQHQPNSANSWFRFGSRKPRYTADPREPMASLTEECDEAPAWPEHDNLGEVDKHGVPLSYGNALPNDSRSSSWFGFRRPKSPKPGRKFFDSDDDLEPTTPRRSSLGSTGRRSSIGSVGPSPDHGETVEPEKSSGGSWFSFRRTKTPSKQPPAPETEKTFSTFTDTTEDWMLEVVGSPRSQRNDPIGTAWLDGKAMLPSETQTGGSSSSWFSGPQATENAVEAQSQTQWLDTSFLSQESSGKPQSMLNPAFFNGTDAQASSFPNYAGAFAQRSRLATETTLPTVASEVEEDGSGSFDEAHPASKDFEVAVSRRDWLTMQ
eukprot:Nitzschia sp. Nitz4//scaffold36_size144017//137348//139393//NITZ4_003119-RA/size144017-processed-gene-0.62-mRNA-1//1//CDS//3329549555//1740//frame0